MAAQRPVGVADAAWLAGAAAVYVLPHVLGLSPDLPHPCAPCDRAAVPAFERFAIRPYDRTADWVSHAGLAAVMLWPLADLAGEGEAGRAHAAALTLSVASAAAVTEVLKNVVQRPRPFLYYDPVGSAQLGDADSRRGFPSAHMAIATAAAASYWWSRRRLDGRGSVEAWVPWLLALGTGVLRVNAGKHFPSDVAAGAVIGFAGGTIVHWLRL